MCRLCAVQMERRLWSQPVDAGAISERGKQQARTPSPLYFAQAYVFVLGQAEVLCLDQTIVTMLLGL